MTRVLPLAILLLVGLGCRRSSPEADADLADGLPWLYANYEGETDRVADMLRNLEARTYMSLDLDAGVVPRWRSPRPTWRASSGPTGRWTAPCPWRSRT